MRPLDQSLQPADGLSEQVAPHRDQADSPREVFFRLLNQRSVPSLAERFTNERVVRQAVAAGLRAKGLA